MAPLCVCTLRLHLNLVTKEHIAKKTLKVEMPNTYFCERNMSCTMQAKMKEKY